MALEPVRKVRKRLESLHVDAQVLPGGKIEIVDDALPVGRVIRVSVSYAVDIREGRDVLDILAEPVPARRVHVCGRGGRLCPVGARQD